MYTACEQVGDLRCGQFTFVWYEDEIRVTTPTMKQLLLFTILIFFAGIECFAQNPCQTTPSTGAEEFFTSRRNQTLEFQVGQSLSGCFTVAVAAGHTKSLQLFNVMEGGDGEVGSVLYYQNTTTQTFAKVLPAVNGSTEKYDLPKSGSYAIRINFTALGTFTLQYQRVNPGMGQGSGIQETVNVTFNVVEAAAPVTWTRDLTYQSAGEQIEMNWSVAEQVDVAGYELEKMVPGGSFEKLSEIAYRENGALEVDYSVRTARPTVGSYYRIKQLDYAGTFDYSNVLFVPGNDAVVEAFDVFPNPVSDFARMSVPATVTSVELISLAGRIVRSVPAAEVRREGMDVRDLAPGVYLVRPVSGSERSVTRRIVVNH